MAFNQKNKRLVGIDVARALAVIGMIIVNFKIAFGQEGNDMIKSFVGLFEGKAAATFVVLAGVGMALMSNTAIKNRDIERIKKIQIKLVRKAIFLFVVGLMYIPIWMADILHFYGVYMLITLLLIGRSKKTIMNTALLFVFIYPLIMLIWNYDIGWNYETFGYTDFWSVSGFIRNLFYNGFHPVLPWVAFMLIGLWYGRQDLYDEKFIKKSIWISLITFIATLLLSQFLIAFFSDIYQISILEMKNIFGTSPMPPLPIYMISGSSIAIFVIASSIFIARKFEKNILINALNKTGQLALTFYVAHVVIGIGVMEIINPEKTGKYAISFSFLYALLFSLTCIIFAIIWTKFKKSGPLEWVMRKLTN